MDADVKRIHDALQAHLTTERVVAAVVCVDDFRLSVQASSGHYCEPRSDKGPWYSVEVGYPSVREEALMPYAEDSSKPTETVYGWVPISLVCEVIAAHGGIKTFIRYSPE